MTPRQRCTGTTHTDQRCQHGATEGADRCGKHPHDAKIEETASLVKRAIDLERELTEEDYASNSVALKKSMHAWAEVTQ